MVASHARLLAASGRLPILAERRWFGGVSGALIDRFLEDNLDLSTDSFGSIAAANHQAECLPSVLTSSPLGGT